MQTNRKLDITAGLLCIVLALVIVFVAIPFGVQEPKKVKFLALSPSYYPRIVACFLLCVGVLLVGLRIPSMRAESPNTASSSWREKIAPFFQIVFVLSLYYAALNYLGFVLSSCIALIALLLLAGERKLWALLSIPVVLPLSLIHI